MTLPRNLIPGQYQIGDILIGRGTTVRVETWDVKPYDVNALDYQMARSDAINFGWDQLKPTTIEITFHVLNNALRPGFESLIPNFWEDQPKLADFQEFWRADDIRYQWGEVTSIFACKREGIPKEIFGRPGQFTYGDDSPLAESVQCLGEFRRADTLAYGVEDRASNLVTTSGTMEIDGTEGDAPSWLRILLQGPSTNPSFTFSGLMNQATSVTFTLNRSVASGEIIEISGEPWNRRVVSSLGTEIGADLNNYVDKLRIKHDSDLTCSFSGGGTARLIYRPGYQVI